MKQNYVLRLMAFLFVMSVVHVVHSATVYLDVPDGYRNSDTPWYVYAWNDNNNRWISGTFNDYGLWAFEVDDSNIIFATMNNSGDEANWDNKKFQTVNETAHDNSVFTITGSQNDGKLTGTWSTLSTTTVRLEFPNTNQNNDVWYAWSYSTANGRGSWRAGTSVGDNLLEFEVYSGKDKIIFVRMNSDNSSVPSWEAKLNQTGDITVQAGKTYVIPGVEGTSNMAGFWRIESNNGKPIWQQNNSADPTTYLSNRRALVGRHCMVNKLINVVGVGSWINDLNNLVDEDLTNYATFPKIADVGVGVNPVTSVRDTKNHYAAGTTAGFDIVMAADASLLGLDVANCFAIAFYLEGELQQTVAVSNGQSFGGVGLSLITLPGSTDVCMEVAATAPCEFDEIALMPAGVNVEVASTARLRYAFVGDLIKHTITQTSMQDYASSHDRLPFSLDQGTTQRVRTNDGILPLPDGVEAGYWAGSDLINDDLTDGVVWGVIGIGSQMEARVGAAMNRQDPDQSQPFKKGSTVGFCYGNGSLLNLPLGDAIRIRLYKGHWESKQQGTIQYDEYVQEEVQDESVKINVLSVNLIKGGNYEVTITANEDFSHARISFPTGLDLNLGGVKVKYAYICDPAEAMHQCDLKLNANTNLCSKDREFTLTANNNIPVSWSLEEVPTGSSAIVTATEPDENGLSLQAHLSGMDLDGDYIIKATAADGCYEFVRLTHGLTPDTSCDNPLLNVDEENPDYALSQINDGGALIIINENLTNGENVLNTTLTDYATYNNLLNGDVANNIPIVGVKKLNGSFSDGSKAHRIGFVVETRSSGLNLDALEFFNIRAYNNGTEVTSAAERVISENNAVKVDLIGSNKLQKLRFAITVPAGKSFDEFVLWKSGVLNLSIDQFRIYYAFDEALEEDEVGENSCIDPLECSGTLMSPSTGATLNSNEVQFAGAVNVANVVNNLSFIVDENVNTGVSVTNTVSLGNGLVLAIDLGRVYTPGQRVGVIVDSKTYLASVNAGDWLTIKTYRNGFETGDVKNEWKVLGADVIGYGDKSFLYMNPQHDYDEVRITIGKIVSALDVNNMYYGIFILDDYDQDGIADCHDDDSCVDEFTLDEEATVLNKGRDITDGKLALHRSFVLNNWNSLILPVNLTWGQLRKAFGDEVLLTQPKDFYSQKPNTDTQIWINIPTYYDPVGYTEDKDNEVAIVAGKYYLIYPTREPDMPRNITQNNEKVLQVYTAHENKQLVNINGPVYFIEGVSYSSSWDGKTPDPFTLNKRVENTGGNSGGSSGAPRRDGDETETIVLHGSNVNTTVSAKTGSNDNYMYQSNNHEYSDDYPAYTDVTSLTKVPEDGTPMLGFRFYAENNTNLPLTNGIDIITGVGAIVADSPVVRSGIYTIDGRKVSHGSDTSNLPSGVYIVNGKKTVILR